MQSTWVARIGIVMFVGGLCLADYSLGVSPATAAPSVKEDALAALTQNWDKNLPSASRFTVLTNFVGAAVRDNNTGLVWEKSPATRTSLWRGAKDTCIDKNVGGQKGWRLPAIAELASLIDPSVPSPGPTLPPGHPFLNVQSAPYWSATTWADDPTIAWGVFFFDGFVDAGLKFSTRHVWCVRGPMQESVY